MSGGRINFGDVVSETDAQHEAAMKEAEREKREEYARTKAQAAKLERERERLRQEYAREQARKKQEQERKKKETVETNERLKLELQIQLYREQYPDYEIPKITEKTPLARLREIKKTIEAKNAMKFIPPMLHTLSGLAVKFYVHMVEEMGVNPLDHEVQGLKEFYMGQVSRQIMNPAWKATVAANPWLIGGNPWWIQVMMGFYMVAEANSMRVKTLQMQAYDNPPETEEGIPKMHPGMREALKRAMEEGSSGEGKGKEKM